MIARPLVCALAAVLVAGLLSPDAAAQKKRAAKPKAPAAPTACSDFYSNANADWLRSNASVPATGSISALEQLTARSRQQQLDHFGVSPTRCTHECQFACATFSLDVSPTFNESNHRVTISIRGCKEKRRS